MSDRDVEVAIAMIDANPRKARVDLTDSELRNLAEAAARALAKAPAEAAPQTNGHAWHGELETARSNNAALSADVSVLRADLESLTADAAAVVRAIDGPVEDLLTALRRMRDNGRPEWWRR